MKNKLTLLPIVLATFAFGQNSAKMPIYSGCEQFETKQELLFCLNKNVKDFTNLYYKTHENILAYFQYPFDNGKISFFIDTKGKLEYKIDEKKSNSFNLMATDFFTVYNLYLETKKTPIIPAKAPDGSPAKLLFNIPIDFKRAKNQIIKDNTTLIRFTIDLDQRYIVKQDSAYNFIIYNQKGESIYKTNSLVDFYSNPILKNLIISDQNLITEQEVDGKKIKLEVFNLFKDQQKEFKILYFEDDKVIEEFNNMDAFLSSKYSKYIY